MSYDEKYRELQKQRKREWTRQYREKNREKLNQYNREWKARHPGYAAESSRKSRERKKEREVKNRENDED